MDQVRSWKPEVRSSERTKRPEVGGEQNTLASDFRPLVFHRFGEEGTRHATLDPALTLTCWFVVCTR